MKTWISLFALIFTISACNNATDNADAGSSDGGDEVEVLFKDVIRVHDEVMPKMGTMGKLQNQLREAWETAEDSTLYTKSHVDLQNAKDGMMDWMHDFEDPRKKDDWDDAARIEYLKGEMEKITEVKEMTWEAIATAEELLKKDSE